VDEDGPTDYPNEVPAVFSGIMEYVVPAVESNNPCETERCEASDESKVYGTVAVDHEVWSA